MLCISGPRCSRQCTFLCHNLEPDHILVLAWCSSSFGLSILRWYVIKEWERNHIMRTGSLVLYHFTLFIFRICNFSFVCFLPFDYFFNYTVNWMRVEALSILFCFFYTVFSYVWHLVGAQKINDELWVLPISGINAKPSPMTTDPVFLPLPLPWKETTVKFWALEPWLTCFLITESNRESGR